MKPITQYTKSGRINIAYQVFGSGPIDLVYIPGWVSNIDWMWACPELVDFFQELGTLARVILFDKRGTGLSDRVVELSTLEERMDDIRAVMEAVGSEKAILFGHSEGGSVSALFAASYPDKVISLITFGIFAKRRYAPNYPWAPTDQERQLVYEMIENNWGGGKMDLESLAPSKANDKTFMDWLANYFRSGASPSAALVLTKMNTEVDIIDILSSIKVPALILQRKHDIDVKIEEGKFIAERIPHAKFVELEGSDHLFWVGDTDTVLNEIKTFIHNTKPKDNYEIKLYTLATISFHSESKSADENAQFIKEQILQFNGKVIDSSNENISATFSGPTKAIAFAMSLKDGKLFKKAPFVIGIHIKEGALDTSHFVSKATERLMESILEQGKPYEILITQTVKYLLSGAGLTFHQRHPVFDANTQQQHILFAVSDDMHSESEEQYESKPNLNFSKNATFLEGVLECIDMHISDDSFGVESLCTEIGISERQLQRKLKSITNKSPIQLISSVRLHRAKELLLEKKLNIAEVAYETGFTNPSYFSKSFKKEFGTSPSSFLESI